jgi:phosphoribosyl 1,2-cyclic phosphodiesterase
MMQIHFWGVRGSLPSPLSPVHIQNKVAAILERLTPEDIQNDESRGRFLAGLPPWLYGTVGGNTPCVSLSFGNSEELIVFDCGSGVRELGVACGKLKPRPNKYHVFFSHFHWDHLQGLPFFNPGYDPSVTVDFYYPKPGLEDILFGQMTAPYFPVKMENMAAKKTFHLMEEPVRIGGLTIQTKKMNHPGDSYSYLVTENGKRFIYATDTELTAQDFMPSEENAAFFRGVDLVVLDCQYTMGEAIDKYNWGHSAFSLAVDFAATWQVKHLVMFHHDPTYSDRKLYGILQSARWYIERMNIKGMELTLATEGLEINL